LTLVQKNDTTSVEAIEHECNEMKD
jgi:hypothetical protein